MSIAAIMAALALPAGAQDAPPADENASEDIEHGFSLLEEGAKIILRSMIDEVEPALKDLQTELGDAWAEMGPVLRDLARMIGQIDDYHPPEMLPNGDIILRRKVPLAPDDRPDAAQPGEEIEI
ncbi:hypothetical protein LV82_02198 [Albidovulum inexpectatum]|uniref:AAA+ family ATPase n=1 Tax=Albidovulum inexpectatum TaxID=196587 RepID=A0A2S5JFS2_9RHOB|nr:hypothetical protein LV82_02198 [Albidovulum inexpectatum]